MRSGSPQLKQFLGREMLRGAFAAVAGAGPNQQAELLHLARDILAMDSPFPAAPREVRGPLPAGRHSARLTHNPASRLACVLIVAPVTASSGCAVSELAWTGMPVVSLDQLRPSAMARQASKLSDTSCSKPFCPQFSCESLFFPSWRQQPGVAQELMRLPAVSPEVLGSFEQAFTAKRSEKDQRNLIRKLLFNSGGCHLRGHSAIAACQCQGSSGRIVQ